MTPSAPPTRSRKTSGLRLAGRVLAGLMVLAGIALAWSHRASLDPRLIQQAIDHQPLAPLVYLALHVIATLVFLPRTLMGVAAGLLFGAVGGFVWAMLGCLISGLAGFWMARFVNDGWIDPEHMARIGPWLRRAESGGWRFVTVFRLIPGVPHSVQNTMLGITQISSLDFLIGSAIGQIPSTLVYVYLGRAGHELMAGNMQMLLAILGLVALLAGSIWLLRRHMAAKHADTTQP